jgi:hypothetical protein
MVRDSVFSFSTVTEANSIKSLYNGVLHNAYIFPNPNNGTFRIMSDNLPQQADVVITVADIAGKVVFQDKRNAMQGNSQFAIHLKDLKAGIYFLKMKADKAQKSFKLIVEK